MPAAEARAAEDGGPQCVNRLGACRARSEVNGRQKGQLPRASDVAAAAADACWTIRVGAVRSQRTDQQAAALRGAAGGGILNAELLKANGYL